MTLSGRSLHTKDTVHFYSYLRDISLHIEAISPSHHVTQVLVLSGFNHIAKLLINVSEYRADNIVKRIVLLLNLFSGLETTMVAIWRIFAWFSSQLIFSCFYSSF